MTVWGFYTNSNKKLYIIQAKDIQSHVSCDDAFLLASLFQASTLLILEIYSNFSFTRINSKNLHTMFILNSLEDSRNVHDSF